MSGHGGRKYAARSTCSNRDIFRVCSRPAALLLLKGVPAMHSHLDFAAQRRAALKMIAAAGLFVATGAHAKSAGIAAYPGTMTGNLKAGANSTGYILFDPLCGACRHMYQNLSQPQYSHLGFKWLPVSILRPGTRADQMAASVLVGGAAGRANLKKVMAGGVPQVTVTHKMRNQLRQNEALLTAVCRQAGQQGRSIPKMLHADGSLVR